MRLSTRAVLLSSAVALAFSAHAAEPTKKDDWYNVTRKAKEQFERDAKLWLATMYPDDDQGHGKEVKAMRGILARIVATYARGGIVFRSNKKKNDWKAFPHPVASLLSHGGRVMIIVKESADPQGRLGPYSFSNWLVTGKLDNGADKQAKNKAAGFRKRTASTHSVTFSGGDAHEKKAKLGNFSGQYGMNVPLGGYGGQDALGEPIANDGLHGHLLLVVKTPSKKQRKKGGILQAILIGVETVAPDAKGTGHLGTKHGLGGAQAVSVTGGNKWSDLKTSNKPGSVDCVRIVIDHPDQLKLLIGLGKKLARNEAAASSALHAPPVPRSRKWKAAANNTGS